MASRVMVNVLLPEGTAAFPSGMATVTTAAVARWRRSKWEDGS